jgi:hypothetical protein
LPFRKRVAAGFFDFEQVLGNDGEEPALVEVLAVNAAGVHVAFSVFRLFDEERTAEENLAAGAAARAFAFAAGEKLFVL